MCETLQYDASALKCPLLFVTAKLWLKKLQPGQRLLFKLNDEIGMKDIKQYLQNQQFEFTLSSIKDAAFQFSVIGKESH